MITFNLFSTCRSLIEVDLVAKAGKLGRKLVTIRLRLALL